VHLLLALLTVAAASDLQSVLPQLVARFEQQTGHTVRTTLGSSGNFLAQIHNGAPFDVFLSADIAYPVELESAGLAEPGTLVPYATGTLVLWTRKGSGVDLRRGIEGVVTDRVRRIAIANPDHAPYGRAAVAALQNSRVYEQARPKLVLGENASQAMQFVQSGNADVGLLPLSLARSEAANVAGDYVAIPPSLYPPIEQAGIVIRSSRNKDAARAFLAFLRQPDVVALLAGAGFGPVRR
jgi:molybdate transport system substrate-binding protein